MTAKSGKEKAESKESGQSQNTDLLNKYYISRLVHELYVGLQTFYYNQKLAKQIATAYYKGGYVAVEKQFGGEEDAEDVCSDIAQWLSWDDKFRKERIQKLDSMDFGARVNRIRQRKTHFVIDETRSFFEGFEDSMAVAIEREMKKSKKTNGE